ncbi:hypothetical protein FQZ97_818170 [compost metagenome]
MDLLGHIAKQRVRLVCEAGSLQGRHRLLEHRFGLGQGRILEGVDHAWRHVVAVQNRLLLNIEHVHLHRVTGITGKVDDVLQGTFRMARTIESNQNLAHWRTLLACWKR